LVSTLKQLNLTKVMASKAIHKDQALISHKDRNQPHNLECQTETRHSHRNHQWKADKSKEWVDNKAGNKVDNKVDNKAACHLKMELVVKCHQHRTEPMEPGHQ
jgi:hypothetical protein